MPRSLTQFLFINFKGSSIESNTLLQKVIIGNENSSVAELIKSLDNQDWVKKGLDYLPKEIDDSGALCPFCQNRTITRAVVSNIRDYFNETYENEIGKLRELRSKLRKQQLIQFSQKKLMRQIHLSLKAKHNLRIYITAF